MLRSPAFREACEKEGMKVDWELVRRIAFENVDDVDPDGGNQLERSTLQSGDQTWSKL